MGTLREDLSTFMTVFRWTVLRTRNVSAKIRTENTNTYFMFNNLFFLKS